MKKYIKPNLYREDMSLSAVITMACDDSVNGLPLGQSTDGYNVFGYVDEYGDIILSNNVPCAIYSPGMYGKAEFTDSMVDCFYKYNCYHNPNVDWVNTMFGGS